MSADVVLEKLVVTTEESVTRTREDIASEVVSLGTQGPRGPKGDPGGFFVTYSADGAVGGHRVVKRSSAGVTYASNDAPGDVGRAIGVTLGAAISGADIEVQQLGEVTEPSWSWTPGEPVYLGTNGVLTQVPPAPPAFMQVIGMPSSPTTLFVRLREPVIQN